MFSFIPPCLVQHLFAVFIASRVFVIAFFLHLIGTFSLFSAPRIMNIHCFHTACYSKMFSFYIAHCGIFVVCEYLVSGLLCQGCITPTHKARKFPKAGSLNSAAAFCEAFFGNNHLAFVLDYIFLVPFFSQLQGSPPPSPPLLLGIHSFKQLAVV